MTFQDFPNAWLLMLDSGEVSFYFSFLHRLSCCFHTPTLTDLWNYLPCLFCSMDSEYHWLMPLNGGNIPEDRSRWNTPDTHQSSLVLFSFSLLLLMLFLCRRFPFECSGHTGAVLCIVIVGGYILTGSSDTSIRRWKAGKCEHTMSGNSNYCYCYYYTTTSTTLLLLLLLLLLMQSCY